MKMFADEKETQTCTNAQWETQGGQGVVQSAHAQNELIDKIIKVMIDLIVKTKCKKL